ncbi:MAG: SulP family inorganic anion transporter [Proteobacteria bacterium]|nr:SulP family inorganic anion transporter [Pseudomonadota bacterium]
MPSSIWGRFFPFLLWLKGYTSQDFRSDGLAGLTVAVVLIPQSMAYAMLAGMPPVYGLYAATITPVIGALWGSLRQLGTGPIAIMSLLVLTTLSPFAEPGSAEYISLAFVLSFMVGVLYFLLGILRMGLIMSFISHSSVKGFTAAAAIIIISTQLPHFLGVSVEKHEYTLPMLINIIRELPHLNPHTFAIGIVSFFTISIIKRLSKTMPASLIALVIATAALMIFDLEQKSVAVIGEIPIGLPSFAIPHVTFSLLSSLAGPTVVIALVSFAETYSVGKAISIKSKQKVDVDQEFIGQGLANLIGSFFHCYPVSGSFSRSAINYAAGAKTGISSIVSSLFVVLSLLFLTPLFTNIPKAALAALVINAVLLLFNPKEVFALLKKNRHDGIVAVTVFIMALVIKPDYALLLGVMMSLIFFLWKTMHPSIVRITKDPELNMFVDGDLTKKPDCPQILQLRIDSEIYFGNAQFFAEHILERLEESSSAVRYLLLDFQAVNFIDITGIDELRVLMEDIKSRGVQPAFINITPPVEKVFISSGLMNDIDPTLIFDGKGTATKQLLIHLDQDYCKSTCQNTLFQECITLK